MTLKEYLIKNDIENLWSDKNTLSPENYTCGSHKKIWIKCDKTDYHEYYEINCYDFIAGKRCPYCSHKKICKKDSIGQYIIDNDLLKNLISPTIEELFRIGKSQKYKVDFKCNKHGIYSTRCDHIIRNVGCPYCSGQKVKAFDSLGSKFPNVFEVWSNKNIKSPFEYSKNSGRKVWWKCANGEHQDYKRAISDAINYGFKCPICSLKDNESSYEKLTKEYLEMLEYNIKFEHDCTFVPKNPKTFNSLPFDNEIVELKLLIEVHGQQHYEYNQYFSEKSNLTSQEYLHKRKLYDRYKKYVAYCNGYNYLEIPYAAFDSKETYKQLIDNKINEIINRSE